MACAGPWRKLEPRGRVEYRSAERAWWGPYRAGATRGTVLRSARARVSPRGGPHVEGEEEEKEGEVTPPAAGPLRVPIVSREARGWAEECLPCPAPSAARSASMHFRVAANPGREPICSEKYL